MEQLASGLNRQKVIDKARRRGGKGEQGQALMLLLLLRCWQLLLLVLLLLLPALLLLPHMPQCRWSRSLHTAAASLCLPAAHAGGV